MPVPLRTTIQKAEARYNVTTEFINYNLHAGAANGDIGLVDYALAQGQPVNSVLDGVLPLHAAAAGGSEQVVLRLIEHGADVNAPRLPRRYSNEKGRDTSAPIVGDSGATPLHFAAANGNTEIVKILLQRGAHPDRADKHGITPEHLARREGWVECADFLKDWARNKDKDLIEREGRIPTYRPSLDEGTSSRSDMQEGSGSGRKRLHVKKSIDTAFHMLKGSASDAHLRLHSLRSTSSRTNMKVGTSFHTPPASPTRSFGEYTFYPVSPTEDGFDPADPSKRRPSLPHIFNPSAFGNRKLSVSSNASGSKTAPIAASITSIKPQPHDSAGSPSPRRPGSAGSDVDRTESMASPPVPRRLGSKYSLMNLFKKGQSSEDASSNARLSLSSATHVPSSGSTYSSASNLSPSPSSHLQLLPITSNDSSLASSYHRTATGIRHATSPSNSMPILARTSSKSQSPPLAQAHRHNAPSAVDLHNAMAQQQYATQQTFSTSPRQYYRDHNRERSTSTPSGNRHDLPPFLVLDDLLQLPEGSSAPTSSSPHLMGRLSSSPPTSTSPRMGVLRAGIAHPRDRSGSGSSANGSRNRSGTVFDDDLVVPSIDSLHTKSSPRPPGPGILRGLSQASSGSGGTGSRALRFNSDLSSRPEEATASSPLVAPSLRGSSSLDSLSCDPPVLSAGGPDSAPATTADFSDVPVVDQDDFEVEDDYGQPLATSSRQKPALDMQAVQRTAIPARLRGFSLTSSSESSFSPIDGDLGQDQLPSVRNGEPVLASDFPFSLNQPPPISLNDAVDAPSQPEPESNLRVPSGDDEEGNRSRGDSVSSASTGVSSQGALATMATPNPDSLGSIADPAVYVEETDGPETTVKISVNISPAQKEPSRVHSGIGHRRTRTPMDINITSISTHAQAEALVQRAQQDILEMENQLLESGGLSTGSAGRTPLSAKLAKYGESLALERRLREQKAKEGRGGRTSDSSPEAIHTSPPSASQVLPESPAGTSSDLGVHRQYSLEHRNKQSRPRANQPQPRRPHTSSGTPEGRNSFATERGKTHQSSLSASIIDVKPPPVIDIRPRALSIDAELESPTTPLVEQNRSHPSAYPSSSASFTSPETDKVQTPPFTGSLLYSEELSRTSSLEANDTDCDGFSGHSSYASISSRAQPREVARATKLTKMGFDASAARQPTPAKRFGGIKSLLQNLKGK